MVNREKEFITRLVVAFVIADLSVSRLDVRPTLVPKAVVGLKVKMLPKAQSTLTETYTES